ncbi:MAG: response regulator [Acidobacteriota bacterium]
MQREETQRDRILLVDDEPNILITTQAILQTDGYEVETANSAIAALSMLQASDYDLVIADLSMPTMDGLELLERAQTIFPLPLFIVLTGYASLESAIKALQLGAYDYLIKPCNVFDLKYSVKRALDRRRLSEAEELLQVSRSINSSLECDRILNVVARAATRMLGLDRGLVLLFEHNQTGERQFRVISEEVCQEEQVVGFYCEHTEIREQLLSGHPFISNNTTEDLRISSKWKLLSGVQSLLVVPIHSSKQLFGMLYVESYTKHHNFNYAALRIIQGLANQAAIALENARLYTELKNKNHELAELNDQLKKLDQLKSNFLNIATHELRTPISIVLGYNMMLRNDMGDGLSAEQAELLDESIVNCRRLIQLINSMLDISRIESGKLNINIAANDIRRCIDSAVKLLREPLRAKQINLKVQMPSQLPLLPFDAERLQQVFINLIDNAIKFSHPGGAITIRAALKKSSSRTVTTLAQGSPAGLATFDEQVLEVSVEDTGVGVPAEEQALIFEEFVQSSNKPLQSDCLPGSGLGLAIAKKIIAAHEGKIWVESQLNKGCKFIFHLPINSKQNHQNKTIAKRRALSKGKC